MVALNKFERTKILGIRAEQIAFGALPTIDVPPSITDPLTISTMELEQRKIPLILRRIHPNGEIVDIKVNEITN